MLSTIASQRDRELSVQYTNCSYAALIMLLSCMGAFISIGEPTLFSLLHLSFSSLGVMCVIFFVFQILFAINSILLLSVIPNVFNESTTHCLLEILSLIRDSLSNISQDKSDCTLAKVTIPRRGNNTAGNRYLQLKKLFFLVISAQAYTFKPLLNVMPDVSINKIIVCQVLSFLLFRNFSPAIHSVSKMQNIDGQKLSGTITVSMMYPIEKNKAHRMFACFCVTPTMLRSILNKNIKEYNEQPTSRTVIISIAKFLPVNIKSNSFNLAKGHIIKINKGCLNNGDMCHRTV